jgi:hypothetical protein
MISALCTKGRAWGRGARGVGARVGSGRAWGQVLVRQESLGAWNRQAELDVKLC